MWVLVLVNLLTNNVMEIETKNHFDCMQKKAELYKVITITNVQPGCRFIVDKSYL